MFMTVKLDLNLLRVFDILMEVRSVSRAADRLGLTQSAVSHALGRMRQHFGDPLFTRRGNGLEPTARAVEMATRVRDGIALLSETIAPRRFDPSETTRSFTISASSYFCVTLVPAVIRRILAEAPCAKVRIIAPGDAFVAGLDNGSIDVALGSFRQFPPRFTRTHLFNETTVWVGCPGRSGDLADRPRLALTRIRYPSLGEDPLLDRGAAAHLELVQLFGDPDAPIPLEVHDVLSVGALIAGSDLVTLLPRHLTDLLGPGSGLEVLEPCDAPEWDMSMLWPTRLASDPAHLWLRGLLADAAADLRH
jgi:DNA-binding transcriptional LysR family regulator